jgi:transposase
MTKPERGGKPASQLAHELGIRRNQLYKWRDQIEGKGDAAFRGPGRKPVSGESEVARLKRELEQVREERDILKKAVAYFARDLP